MNKKDFIALKDFILSLNKYFQNGYANAFKDDETGAIYALDGTDFLCVFPNDTLGNYFYLRNSGTIDFRENNALRISDCGGVGFDDVIEIDLIAIVNDADEYQLITALRNTIIQYKGLSIKPTRSNFNTESVVFNELRGIDKNEIAAALQRLKDETIVSIKLRVSKQFIPNKCIINPCKTDC